VSNRLSEATSPYLLQHAENPVDWHPWGPEALELAAAEDKPILLSIGYSACHWCHVMERESFEDEAIAALMNEHFVPVKVDREERPDIDEIYMAATLAMNQGQGGWPMTVFLTPGQEPFFAGTYFPPEDRWGRPGFKTLLARIAELWSDERPTLLRQAGELTALLLKDAEGKDPVAVGREAFDAAITQLGRAFDTRFGGFGGAPKFPPSGAIDVLLRHHRRTRDPFSLQMAATTLDHMARGGMHDQLGGGFSRYSTDERWLVPHFEKMLYDNALLSKAYLAGWQVTKDPYYREVVTDLLEYEMRDMRDPAGAFWSSSDADSEGVEGKFFVWTPEEVEAALGAEDVALICRHYDIQPGGNWEGSAIPNVALSLATLAKLFDLEPDEAHARVRAARDRLREVRAERIAPAIDDKVLTGWNGLMISALAEASRVFREPRYLDAAREAADFLLATLRSPDGSWMRSYSDGRAGLDAVLADHAYLASGLLDLYEAGAESRYLAEAVSLAELMLERFEDPVAGGFHTTSTGHERLIVRRKEGQDGAIPNASAVAAEVLARLSFHTDRLALREAAQRALDAFGADISRFPRAFARSLAVVDLLDEGPVELAIIGDPTDPRTEALWSAVADRYVPNRIVAHGPADAAATHPLLAGKGEVTGAPALYICRSYACAAPITDPELVAEAL
jgi:uncharacterized protein YyaL (SSP411 family)